MGAVNVGFSIATSLCLSTIYFFLGWLSLKYNWSMFILQWAIFPVIAYCISFLMNLTAQIISCRKANIPQLFANSLIVPGFILLFFLLTLISFIRSPIEAVISPSSRPIYGPIFAVSFYVFWATMFGEALSVGAATAC
jgi:hypothetical protein